MIEILALTSEHTHRLAYVQNAVTHAKRSNFRLSRSRKQRVCVRLKPVHAPNMRHQLIKACHCVSPICATADTLPQAQTKNTDLTAGVFCLQSRLL
jgi:hypothetical protein